MGQAVAAVAPVPGESAVLGDAESSGVLAAFEQGVLERLAHLTGRSMGAVGVRGRGCRGPAPKLRVVRQPWFGPVCRAAKAAWRRCVTSHAPPEEIAEAKRLYRRSLRRS